MFYLYLKNIVIINIFKLNSDLKIFRSEFFVI